MFTKAIFCCAVLATLALTLPNTIHAASLRHVRASSLRDVHVSARASNVSHNETTSAEYVVWSWSGDDGDKYYEVGISWPCDLNATQYQVCFDTQEQDCEGGDDFAVHTNTCVLLDNNTCKYNTGDSQSTYGCNISYSNVSITAFTPGNTTAIYAASLVDSLPALQKQCTGGDDENATYVEVNVTSLEAGEFVTANQAELVLFTATWEEIENSNISGIEVCFYTKLQAWAPGSIGSTQQTITCTVVPPTATNATATVNVTVDVLSVNGRVRLLPSCLLSASGDAGNGSQSNSSAYPRQLYTEMSYQNFSNSENLYNCTAVNDDGVLIGAACGSNNTLRVVHEPEWTPCLPSKKGVPLQQSTTGRCVSVSGSDSEPVLAECDGSEEQQWVGYKCDKPASAQYATINLRNVASGLCLSSTEDGGMAMAKCNNAQSGSSNVFRLTSAPASGSF